MESKLPVSSFNDQSLIKNLNKLYQDQLNPQEVADIKDGLVRFFELLFVIDKRNEEPGNEASQNERPESTK